MQVVCLPNVCILTQHSKHCIIIIVYNYKIPVDICNQEILLCKPPTYLNYFLLTRSLVLSSCQVTVYQNYHYNYKVNQTVLRSTSVFKDNTALLVDSDFRPCTRWRHQKASGVRAGVCLRDSRAGRRTTE